jgi:hypothetical protein
MLRRILRDLAISSALCLGERVLERLMFPGVRLFEVDPSRANDLSLLVAEAIAVLVWVWLFNGSLYAIGYLTGRPLKPQVPTLVTLIILLLFLGNAYTRWATMTPLPPQ